MRGLGVGCDDDVEEAEISRHQNGTQNLEIKLLPQDGTKPFSFKCAKELRVSVNNVAFKIA